MRGFRGNRAVINFKAALNGQRQGKHQFGPGDGGFQSPHASPEQKKELPAWLKMPAQVESISSVKKSRKTAVAKSKPAPKRRKAA